MPHARPPRPARLEITGLAAQPGFWDEEALRALARPSPAGGTAVEVGAVLEACRPQPEASHVTAVNAAGDYTASIPLAEASRGELLVVGEAEGGPIRLNIPQGRTMCWNVKDVGMLRLTAGPEPDSVPENPPH